MQEPGKYPYIFRIECYIDADFIENVFFPLLFFARKRVEYCIRLTRPRAIWFAYRYKMEVYRTKTRSEIIAISLRIIRNKHRRYTYSRNVPNLNKRKLRNNNEGSPRAMGFITSSITKRGTNGKSKTENSLLFPQHTRIV